MAGEAFLNSVKIDAHRYFSKLDGLIILLDLSVEKKLQQGSGDQTHGIQNVINVLLEQLNSIPGLPKKGSKYAIPCAVVLSKADSDPGLAALLGAPRETPTPAPKITASIDNQCRTLLVNGGLANVVSLIETHFQENYFLAASAQGWPMESGKTYYVDCPKCGATLRVGGDKAGKAVGCPKCKNAVPVPARVPVRVADPLKFILLHHKRWI